MHPAFAIYITSWSAFCAVAAVLAVADRRISRETGPYLRFIAAPWKVAVFVPALLFVTFAGKYSFDDTWDVVTGGGMSVLTYLTAPWAVGTAYLVLAGLRPRRHAVIAAALCLFSSSWFYDAWLLYRDGSYTGMWLPNLLLSPFLYAAGGILWNLEVTASGRPILGFSRTSWPEPPSAPQARPILVAVAAGPVIVSASIPLLSVKWQVLPW